MTVVWSRLARDRLRLHQDPAAKSSIFRCADGHPSHNETGMARRGRGSRWGVGAALLLQAGALLASMLCAAAEENAPGTTGVLAALVGGKRTLVLADGPQIQDSHSMFFAALKVGLRSAVYVCVWNTLSLFALSPCVPENVAHEDVEWEISALLLNRKTPPYRSSPSLRTEHHRQSPLSRADLSPLSLSSCAVHCQPMC